MGARFLVAERDKAVVGMNGMILEKQSGIGRFFTGAVVRSTERKRGIGSMLLYVSLRDIKAEGLRKAEVETREGISASKYLYPKYGGQKHTVQKLILLIGPYSSSKTITSFVFFTMSPKTPLYRVALIEVSSM